MASDKILQQPRIRPWQWFVLAGAAPIAITAGKLNLDLWHDEIYTVIFFVAQGPRFIVTDYSLANNHPFYSLVLWPFYCLSDSNLVLRLPSLIFTAATLAFVFRLALRRMGLVGAVTATAVLGLNQMFLIHAVQVRGYGLSMCLTACLADLALAPRDAPAWRRWAAIALVGAAFLYVMPTNLLMFIPLAVVAATDRWLQGPKQFATLALEVGAWTAAGVLALLAYLPIAGQIVEVGRHASPGSWGNVANLIKNFLSPALHDVWWLPPLAAIGAGCWAFRRRAPQARHAATVPLLAVAVFCGAFLLCGALRISPFERNYCPLLPLLALLVGWSLAGLAAALLRRWPALGEELVAVVGCVLFVLAIAPALWTYPSRLDERRREAAAHGRRVQDGYYNYYAADYRPSQVAAWLADQHIEQKPYVICYAKEDHLDVAYYFERIGLPIYHRVPRHAYERPVEVFAILPAGGTWEKVAERCRLTADEVRQFEHIGDFGYHQLCRSRQPLHVGLPADNLLGD